VKITCLPFIRFPLILKLPPCSHFVIIYTKKVD